MGNCGDFCNPTPEQTIVPFNEKTLSHPAEITAGNFHLRCEICGTGIQDSNLRRHLDLVHFTQVIQKPNSQYEVVCLLCLLRSPNLETQKNHLRANHPYLEGCSRQILADQQRGVPLEPNQIIRQRVTPISKLDFVVHSDGRTGQIAGDIFDVQTYQQEYPASNFDQNIAKGDLVWSHVFTEYRDAAFYNVQFVPKQKSVLALSKIFYKRRNF